MGFFAFFFLILSTKAVSVVDEDTFSDEEIKLRMRAARKDLEILDNNPESPCWRQAQYDLMEMGCKSESITTYFHRSKLALSLANCHLYHSGLKTYQCNKHQKEVRECVVAVAQDAIAYSVYNLFFGKVDDICHYAKVEIFQEDNLRAIGKLYTASEDVVYTLNSLAKAEKKRHQLLLQDQENMKTSFEEITAKLEEIRKIDLMILFELFSMTIFVFYSIVCIFAHLSTMFTRTESARLWVYLWIFCSAMTEHLLVRKYLQSVWLNDAIYIWRRMCCIIIVLLLMMAILSYKNMQKEALRYMRALHTEMERSRQEDVLRSMESIFSNSLTSFSRARSHRSRKFGSRPGLGFRTSRHLIKNKF